MPNNRQWAVLFWLVVLLGWALSQPELRSNMRDIARAALEPVLLLSLVMMAAWMTSLVYAAERIGLWDLDLATDTVFWFVFAGLVLFGAFGDATKQEHFFRRKVLTVLEIGIAVEVLSDFFVLNLVVEIVLVQPGLALLTVLSVAAARRAEHRMVKVVADSVLIVASVAILSYVAVSLLHNWSAVDKGDLVREFALPVWLTVGALPFVYAVGLLDAYMSVFRRIDRRSEAGWCARAKSKLALLMTFHVRARKVGKLSASLELNLSSASSFRQARRAIRNSQQECGAASTPA